MSAYVIRPPAPHESLTYDLFAVMVCAFIFAHRLLFVINFGHVDRIIRGRRGWVTTPITAGARRTGAGTASTTSRAGRPPSRARPLPTVCSIADAHPTAPHQDISVMFLLCKSKAHQQINTVHNYITHSERATPNQRESLYTMKMLPPPKLCCSCMVSSSSNGSSCSRAYRHAWLHALSAVALWSCR